MGMGYGVMGRLVLFSRNSQYRHRSTELSTTREITVMECLEADIEMAPEEEEGEDETSSYEGGEELSLDDREENEDFQRHPLERDEEGQEEGDDGHVELESESDNDEGEEDDTVTVGGGAVQHQC